jgi:hypothetical protein
MWGYQTDIVYYLALKCAQLIGWKICDKVCCVSVAIYRLCQVSGACCFVHALALKCMSCFMIQLSCHTYWILYGSAARITSDIHTSAKDRPDTQKENLIHNWPTVHAVARLDDMTVVVGSLMCKASSRNSAGEGRRACAYFLRSCMALILSAPDWFSPWLFCFARMASACSILQRMFQAKTGLKALIKFVSVALIMSANAGIFY